jgi:putative salt-induced outer membrane protein YdiY
MNVGGENDIGATYCKALKRNCGNTRSKNTELLFANILISTNMATVTNLTQSESVTSGNYDQNMDHYIGWGVTITLRFLLAVPYRLKHPGTFILLLPFLLFALFFSITFLVC